MFDTLTDRFEGIFGRVRRKGRLTESDVDEVLREIRQALLEADVNLAVAKDLCARLKERLVGADISQALNPAQQIIKAVNEELTDALGGPGLKITFASKPPTVVLLAGLQGAGKTTTAGKLARWFKAQGRNPLLVGADLQRPAAVEQLRVLGKQVGVTVFSEPTDPVSVVRAAMAEARRIGKDVVIVDTAGRLAIDEALMQEVREVRDAAQPHYTLLVIDAMIGQDAVQTAQAFNETLELDGVIVTKLDGDTRGGAALSVKHVVGKPIAFASVGEKLTDFEPFYPDRMASRILGKGDVLSLIEKAEQEFDHDVAAKGASKIMGGEFGLDDFLEQLQQVKKMGPLTGLMKMMPGVPKEMRNAEIDDNEVGRIEAIIKSMTPAERADPDMISASRRERIARGSGRPTAEINMLLKQFKEVQKMMKSFGKFAPGAKSKKSGKGARTSVAGTQPAGAKPKLGSLPGLPSLGGGQSGGFPGLNR
jgi:signal recognition particle subunit SRP54